MKMMRSALHLLVAGLSVQETFGQMNARVLEVYPINKGGYRGDEFGKADGFERALQDATVAGTAHLSTDRGLAVVPAADAAQLTYERYGAGGNRELLVFFLLGVIVGLLAAVVILAVVISVTIYVSTTDGRWVSEDKITLEFDDNGRATTTISIDSEYLNDDGTDFSDEYILGIILGDCLSGDCSGYLAANNVTAVPTITGDPHMVGLLGQKIDWAGVDNAWYCILSDGPDFHLNVRLTAPMPKEFPDRQLVSAVSILSNNGHSVLVEVKNPYSTVTTGCPEDAPAPCLAEGGVRVLVDGEEFTDLQAPAESVRLPGGFPVVVSAANLPAECRPFGGDRIWAAAFSAMMTSRRNLRANDVSFDKWILQVPTLAAPTWCAKFLEEGGSAGLMSTSSNHVTFRVETPVADVRINIGMNFQDLETAPDGTVLVPELEFWQTDFGFDGLRLSDDVAGLMGDTSRFVLDSDGIPVTSGLGALHGPVESYRVAGPFARDFEKLHQ